MKQCQAIFESTTQGMYLYLDDEHAACNAVLAKWLGYKAPKDWAKAGMGDFVKLVDPSTRHALVKTYQDAMQKAVAGQAAVTWIKADKKTLKTNVILVPFDFEDHRLALHFIT